MKLNKKDLDFIYEQLSLPNNNPLLDPLGKVLSNTGIRDVQGVGNNLLNPTWGAADTVFPRATYNALNGQPLSTGGFTGDVGFTQYGPSLTGLAYNPAYDINYSTRGNTVIDAAPRIISNLLSSQDGLTPLQVQDNPADTQTGRLSPLTGNVNPLPYSSYMTLFGQFFDHGLDFVHKGADGNVFVPLLPGDPLYVPGSPYNYMIASRTNTVNVTIGAGSTDALIDALGLGQEGDVGYAPSWSVVESVPLTQNATYSGTLVINNKMIALDGATAAGMVDAINAQKAFTGVTAEIVANKLVLTPALGESMNTTSPYIDLSQSYGSVASHTVFVREYDAGMHITGRLVSASTVDANGHAGMATWADIKANAAKIGITLHDYNVTDVPLVYLNQDGTPYIGYQPGTTSGPIGAWLIALNKTSGAIVYVQDTDVAALDQDNLVLMTTGHAFLDDMAHGVLSGLDASGDVSNAAKQALLEAHFVAGDGRANENIGLTAIHDVFHAEHERVLKDIIATGGMVKQADGSYIDDTGRVWTGEDLFQAAKLVTEMEYQHLVFGEFARKLSPNINAFAAYDISIDASITAEFAHAVYRFGHSMLTEFIDLAGYDTNGIASGSNEQMLLMDAFLNPRAYQSGTTAGEIAIGMSSQVGNAIDEWVTDALRNNLVGLPLDLATLNLVRGRDAGIPTLNEVRQTLFDQTQMSTLKPYESWDEFGANLLHPESLKNFIMAYARDAILNDYGGTPTGFASWDELQLNNAAAYAIALSDAADKALNDSAFMMGGNTDFWNIDLWIGGLAEAKVADGMLGSTFDLIFASQMINLQNGDRFYYLDRLAGTNLLAEIEGQLFSDIVMRNTGVQHLYSDIFSVADDYVEISQSPDVYGSLAALRAADKAGWVGDTFYGNPGDYTDARGVANPNTSGHASEMIGGTANSEKINGLGGNDTIWGDGGDDVVEGGAGNDFLHGGDGNDTLTDTQGDDLMWGDAGNDVVNGGNGLDQVFGGSGDDTVYGGLGADLVNGQEGNDVVFGDNGAGASGLTIVRDQVTGKVLSVTFTGTMDPTGDADVIAGDDGHDVLFGGGGADSLNGGVGDDWLFGGAGNDAMIGWDGNDRFVMDAADLGYNNAMDGGLGFDVVDYSASSGQVLNGVRVGVNVNLSNAGPAVVPVGINLPDSFLSVEGAIGSAYDDRLIGGLAVQTDQAGNPLPLLDAQGNPVPLIDPLTGAPQIDPLTGQIVFATIPVDFVLDGRAGNDYLEGGNGNDTLIGGLGNDNLVGGAGSDTASYADAAAGVVADLATGTATGAGNDILTAIENLMGSAFDDRLTGDAAVNTLTGGAGNDTLDGAAGADTMIGGAGDDTYVVDNAGDVVIELANEGTDTVNSSLSYSLAGTQIENLTLTGTAAVNATGNDFANVLTGNNANNVLNAGAGNDTLTGGGGNDTLNGGAGADNMAGGTGNDTYFVDDAGDVVTEAANAGTDTVNAAVSYLLGANLENLVLTGSNAINGTGNDAANTLTGNAGANRLSGLNGNDSLSGGAGNDTLIGGLGVDVLTGGSGNDMFVFDAVDSGTTAITRDTIRDFARGQDLIDFSSFGSLSFIGTAAFTALGQVRATSVNGATLVEVNLSGSNAADFSLTVQGTTTLSANDFILAGGAPAQTPLTIGAPGPITLSGTAGRDNLTGTAQADTIDGGAGNDNIWGLAGDDYIMGGAGNDAIYGGLGNDVLVGGAGNDFFVFNTPLGASNIDTIVDYDAVRDTIRLDRAVFSGLTRTASGTIASMNFVNGTQALDANDRIIYNAANGALLYDADGNGGGAAVQFATLQAPVGAITAADFFVI
jgi:Ca2+-binding RTX toxin-like protein